MVKRTPRKRNAAAAETSVLEKVSCEEEMEEDKPEETGEGKGGNEIEENPLFEELSEDGEEKLDSRVFHENMFFKKKISATHHASAWGLV